jgi:hypothetical protein
MSSVRDVLEQHQRAALGMLGSTPDLCTCGARIMPGPQVGDEDISVRRNRAFAAHQAGVEITAKEPVKPNGITKTVPGHVALGRYVNDLAKEMLRETQETGYTMSVKFNDAELVVTPVDTVDFAVYRWRVKSGLTSLRKGYITAEELQARLDDNH